MMNRLYSTLDFICTYEKVVMINNKIIDVIEEFNIEDDKVILYGYHNTYEFVFSSINIKAEGTSVSIYFNGKDGGVVSFR